jgi:hypothetical protein
VSDELRQLADRLDVTAGEAGSLLAGVRGVEVEGGTVQRRAGAASALATGQERAGETGAYADSQRAGEGAWPGPAASRSCRSSLRVVLRTQLPRHAAFELRPGSTSRRITTSSAAPQRRGQHGTALSAPVARPAPHGYAESAWLLPLEWPREESNLRTQIRSLPLYPLSYGAQAQYARGLVRIRGAPARIRGSPVEAERQALGPRAKILSAVPAFEITAALPPTASLPRIFVSPLTASVTLLPSLR